MTSERTRRPRSKVRPLAFMVALGVLAVAVLPLPAGAATRSLPPVDDHESATADWLRAIGFEPATTTAESTASTSTTTITGITAVSLVITDEARGRTMAVTVKAPTTGGPYPLVVLVHGYAASAADYDTLTDALAWAGFVVAAPDFPRSSRTATSAPERDYHDQAADVSYVIDRLTDGVTAPDLTARIDRSAIAVAGHSDGGITAAGVAFNSEVADPRIGAAVVMSGAAFGFSGSWFAADPQPALLVLHGTADSVNPIGASQSMFAQAEGAKTLVEVTGGSHAGPFTTDATVPAVAQVIADFLHRTFTPSAAADARLIADASAAPLFIAG